MSLNAFPADRVESGGFDDAANKLFSLLLDHARPNARTSAALETGFDEFDALAEEMNGAAARTRQLIAEAERLLR